MPRSNRPRRRGRTAADEREPDADDAVPSMERMLQARLHVEPRRDGAWNVQPVVGLGAEKTYVCPGCGLAIRPGTAHTVAWRADGVLGEADDIAGRRHWHTHCWRIRP